MPAPEEEKEHRYAFSVNVRLILGRAEPCIEVADWIMVEGFEAHRLYTNIPWKGMLSIEHLAADDRLVIASPVDASVYAMHPHNYRHPNAATTIAPTRIARGTRVQVAYNGFVPPERERGAPFFVFIMFVGVRRTCTCCPDHPRKEPEAADSTEHKSSLSDDAAREALDEGLRAAHGPYVDHVPGTTT